jgi:hypothetical protein
VHLLLQAIGTGGPQSSGRSPFPSLGRRASSSIPSPSDLLRLPRPRQRPLGRLPPLLDLLFPCFSSWSVTSPVNVFSRRRCSPSTLSGGPLLPAPPSSGLRRRGVCDASFRVAWEPWNRLHARRRPTVTASVWNACGIILASNSCSACLDAPPAWQLAWPRGPPSSASVGQTAR